MIQSNKSRVVGVLALNAKVFCFALLLLGVGLPFAAFAQTIPDPARIDHLQPATNIPKADFPDKPLADSKKPSVLIDIPAGADQIIFTLNSLTIHGVTAYEEEQFKVLYKDYIGEQVALTTIYQIAGAITNHYRDDGYFISQAYVPEQQFIDGNVRINVIEGSIGKVAWPDDLKKPAFMQRDIEDLQAAKPISMDKLENFLLNINALPGYSVSGVLSPLPDAPMGTVQLMIEKAPHKSQGGLNFNNHLSRYLGPHNITASYLTSVLPLHQTYLAASTSMPVDKLNYFSFSHGVAISSDTMMDISGSYIQAEPGYTLEALDVESDTTFLSVGIRHQFIRQRDENAKAALSLDIRNSNMDILNTAFVRDRIRAVRGSIDYDVFDAWDGYMTAHATLSRGIEQFGSSDKGDPDLSRAQARPDFTKVEMTLSRLQSIHDDWSMLFSTSGQYASGPLFSSEEFGYGGQSYGRAYDINEISGDHGISALIELHYNAVEEWNHTSLTPYVFYDAGKVWNEDIGQIQHASGTSAGLGVRADTLYGISGNLALAFPLTRDISGPIYGQGTDKPRIIFELNKEF